MNSYKLYWLLKRQANLVSESQCTNEVNEKQNRHFICGIFSYYWSPDCILFTVSSSAELYPSHPIDINGFGRIYLGLGMYFLWFPIPWIPRTWWFTECTESECTEVNVLKIILLDTDWRATSCEECLQAYLVGSTSEPCITSICDYWSVMCHSHIQMITLMLHFICDSPPNNLYLGISKCPLVHDVKQKTLIFFWINWINI